MAEERGPRVLVVAWIAASFCVVSAPACGGLTAEQRAAAARVQIITADPALDCQNLGAVSGSRDNDGAGGIRGQAVLLGGNTVRLDAHGGTTAYYCPGPAQPRLPVPVMP